VNDPRIQSAISDLAMLRPGWSLLADTDPKEFLEQVTLEICTLRRNLERCGREMKALYGERDELFELQSKAASIEHAVDKATESLSVEKSVNAALRKRIAELEAKLQDTLEGKLIAELEAERDRLATAIRNQCANLCTEAWASRGKHHPDCLAYELEGGEDDS